MDGWRHLYFVDVAAPRSSRSPRSVGASRHRQDRRTGPAIWFSRIRRLSRQDPYLLQYGRVNFDGTGLTWLTEGNGNHSLRFPSSAASGNFSPGPDLNTVLVAYSRAIASRHRTSPRQRRQTCRRAGKSPSRPAPPISPKSSPPRAAITRPISGASFAGHALSIPRGNIPSSKTSTPGPQAPTLQKLFPQLALRALTNLGFIVVQMDGMGTAGRSKAFHDVCWQNSPSPADSPTGSTGSRPPPPNIPPGHRPASGSSAPARRPERRRRRALSSRFYKVAVAEFRLP